MKMKILTRSIIFLALLAFILFPMSGFSDEQEKSFTYARLYPDEKGISHFVEVRLDLHPYGYGMGMYHSSDLTTKTIRIFRAPSDFEMGWHTAPAKQFVFVLNGAMEVESGNGEKRLFSVGSVLLVEDTTGQGHKTKSVGKEELVLGWVRIP